MNYDTKEFIESLSISDLKALIEHCVYKYNSDTVASDMRRDYIKLHTLCDERLSDICMEVFSKDPMFKTFTHYLNW